MILYFSGTGNTRWVAQQIAEAIGEELLYIPDLIREGRYQLVLKADERLGFCFPTHGIHCFYITLSFCNNFLTLGFIIIFPLNLGFRGLTLDSKFGPTLLDGW